MIYDYAIIGSGIIGTNIAKELSRYECKLIVLEKENDVANGQTIANSAIIHSGHDPKPNTLKARLCVEGNALYDDLEKDLHISLLRTGAFLVAHNNEEEKQLDDLYHRSLINGVKDVTFISKDEARKLEPNLADDITKVLSLPSTKVCFSWEVAFACMELAIKNGTKLKLNAKVTAIKKHDDIFTITINHKEIIKVTNVINAAGVFADEIANMIEPEPLYKITPRKGEYLVLDRKVKGFMNRVIYGLPTAKGKGVLITPQVHGNILLGPTSEIVKDKEVLSTSLEGMKKIKEDVIRLGKNIPFDKTIRNFAGIRASSIEYDDFYLKESPSINGFYHAALVDSPGLTSAPAIAKYLVNEVIKPLFPLKTNYKSTLKPKIVFYEQDEKTKERLLRKDPRYGNLICKCERISEKEIIDAIKGPLGNDTIKGIKKRVRAGSGLCQGGYCEEKILKIIAREKGKPLNTINYYGKATPILLKETKVK